MLPEPVATGGERGTTVAGGGTADVDAAPDRVTGGHGAERLRTPGSARSGEVRGGETASPPRVPERVGRRRGRLRPYVFITPLSLLLGVLVLYPLLLSLIDSARLDNLLVSSSRFVGVANYVAVLTDPQFVSASIHTLGYFAFATVGAMAVGGAMAFWLHGLTTRARAAALVLVMVPWAVPGTVTGALWSFIYNPTSGLLNGLLVGAGILRQPIVWIEGTKGIFFISIALIWQVAPIVAILLLAALESIPGEIFEQASLDGAFGLKRFRHISVPLLRPAVAICLVETAILGLGAFDQVVVLSAYAPATLSVVMKIYQYAFTDLNFGEGISASLFLTTGTLLISFLYLKAVYREVEY